MELCESINGFKRGVETYANYSGSLKEAISVICKKPLAIRVPESKAAGTLSLLNI